MSGFQTIPEDMEAASNAATEAAELARAQLANPQRSSEKLWTARAAIPGSNAAQFFSDLSFSWDREITAWADDTESFGTDVAILNADYRSADNLVDSRHGGLHDGVGRG